MVTRKALAFAVGGTALYLGLLVWADTRKNVFAMLPTVAALLPVLMLVSLASYALRYVRWHWLLRRAGHPTPWLSGWLAYLTGFAFTVSPGKVGELVRIRYFLPMGVAPATVVGAFVFERATDLAALLLLAALGIQDREMFVLLLVLVATVIAAVAWFAARPTFMRALVAGLRRRGHRLAARLLRTLQRGLQGCRLWANGPDIAVSLLLGLAAWGLTAVSFAWLLSQLGISIPAPLALALYPTAMLAGAASMVPGGIGATEAVIVALLAANGIALGAALLAAVAIRLSGLWFSIGCGLFAMAALERRAIRHSLPRKG
jgi:uncharacterized protein (TIRG00374 family)